MNVQQLFPHLGKVIAGTGSSQFVRLLHDLISASLDVDATQITQHRTKSVESANVARAAGQVGKITHRELVRTVEPTILSAEQLANLRVDKDGGFYTPAYEAPRRSGDYLDHTEVPQVHLASHSNNHRCVISVYRSSSGKMFTSQECAHLRDLSWILLPIVEAHIATLTPQLVAATPAVPVPSGSEEDAAMESLRQRFMARAHASQLSLSLRETEVCLGLLAGLTVPQLAERLKLKASTVESYFKRAVVKMGVSGRSPLLRWLHATDIYQQAPVGSVFQNAV
jgi:DNA-binding CsgD family transcriptional regulator